jgi:hypothetical protein
MQPAEVWTGDDGELIPQRIVRACDRIFTNVVMNVVTTRACLSVFYYGGQYKMLRWNGVHLFYFNVL